MKEHHFVCYEEEVVIKKIHKICKTHEEAKAWRWEHSNGIRFQYTEVEVD